MITVLVIFMNAFEKYTSVLSRNVPYALCSCISNKSSVLTGTCSTTTTTTLQHPFNNLFSGTTLVSRYQKGKTSPDLNETRDDGVLGWQQHQLDHMQTIWRPIYKISYDNHPIMKKLRLTDDKHLICKTSHEGYKAFLRYDSLAKL